MAGIRVVGPTSHFGKTIAVFLVTATLAGCADSGGFAGMGNKETSGTAIGAVIGGVGGAFLGRGAGKAVAIIAGAAIGGLIGNRVGAMLDTQDQQALAEQSRLALVTQPDGRQIDWTSDHSGATAAIVPTNTRVEQRQVKVVRDADVIPSADLDMIGAAYVVKTGSAVVRLAPSAHAAAATTLRAGQSVWAVGKVHGQNWIMVAQHGKSIGYMAESSVRSADMYHVAANSKPNHNTAAQSLPSAPAAAFDLDTVATVRTPADLDAMTSDKTAKVDTVVANVTCRDLRTSAVSQGKTENSTQTACRAPDGSWDIE